MNPVTKAADVTMAQAGGAQREPSMEEILASIRRIIEDNDSGRDSGRRTPILPPVEAEFEAESSVEAPVESSVVEVDAFRAEFRAPQPVRTETKHVTLAEVQAQVVKEQPAEEPAFAELSAGNDTSSMEAIGAEESEEEDLVTASAETFAVEQPAPLREAVAQEPVRPESALKPAIVSERTERQVAAAFGELSEAFAARSKKTFDEMAEEMLRPMLQDWLDNNLPTLVERLVREEIERVARGAQ